MKSLQVDIPTYFTVLTVYYVRVFIMYLLRNFRSAAKLFLFLYLPISFYCYGLMVAMLGPKLVAV
jgi:hypothetical protein